MPTYQYVCTECGTPLEVVQRFTDAALVECPTCGGRLRKVFSAVGVVFKGSGFYRTDSRDSATKTEAKAKSDDSSAKSSTSASSAKPSGDGGSSSSSSSGAKTDAAKPATKSAAGSASSS